MAIDTNIQTGAEDKKILCRGTHVYRNGQGDTLDPGLVLTGTKCGDNAVGTKHITIICCCCFSLGPQNQHMNLFFWKNGPTILMTHPALRG